MGIVVNLIIVALIFLMAYALISEGAWGATLMFFNVLFGAMVAFNFYEPLAKLLADNASILAGYADLICFFLLFLFTTLILRLTTETLAPAMVRFPTPLFHVGRIFFAVLGSALTLAVVLLGFETAPVHKKIFGVIDYKALAPFGLGIERQFLGFFQYSTGQIFVTHVPGTRDPFDQYGDAKVFDPRAEWLLNHQDARPYGTETVLGEAEAAPAAAGGAPAPAGAPGAGAGNAKPGDINVVGPAVGGGVVVPP
jgi:hypothetical protein